jgi:CopG family transcriptional regulator, nickel-responsive regulator
MQRLTISIDDELAADFESLVQARGYENRSEAFRDLVRRELDEQTVDARPDAPCVATLTYLYDHHERALAARIVDMQHEHHELTVSTMHAHIDHDLCVETLILRGPADEVRHFAESMLAQRGVHHGQLHLVPVDRG